MTQHPGFDEWSLRIRDMYPRLLLRASRLLRRAGVLEDPADIVQAAILALLDGRCPADVEIGAFLDMKMRSRVSNAARHMSRVTVELVPSVDDDFVGVSAGASTGAGALHLDVAVDELTVTNEVVSYLVDQAQRRDDVEVELMLEALKEGKYTRAELADYIEISPTKVDAAKRRLATICRSLPIRLREAVQSVFGIIP